MSDSDIVLPDPGPGFRQWGMLYAEIAAPNGPATLHAASWVVLAAKPEPVGLALVFCTFNREREILEVLRTLGGDRQAMDLVARIIVVDQGQPGLAVHPEMATLPAAAAAKIRLVQQENFGGAGGFGRGLLEARRDRGITHVVLIDDDVRIEPESILRMHAFFSLASGEMAVGGHMLDAVRPCTLYEAGAVVGEERWALYPMRMGEDLRDPDQLASLLDIRPAHYNGWWMFGFPISFIDRVGMPLPCFIRGDDVEFGLRLSKAGLHVVTMPGVAIWHEPFYLKIGGWQLYYETRNMLVAAALHLNFQPGRAAALMMGQFLRHLLTCRYYSAALILRGIEDFLKGPEILRGPPLLIHAPLAAMRTQYPAAVVPRERWLPQARLREPPRGPLSLIARGVRVGLDHLMRRTAIAAPLRHLAVRDLAWHRVERFDAVAVDTYWDRDLLVLRRSREDVRALLARGVRLFPRLLGRSSKAARAWRVALPRLSSIESWERYLGLAGSPIPIAAGLAGANSAGTVAALRPVSIEGDD